jgi:hypothetical protein
MVPGRCHVPEIDRAIWQCYIAREGTVGKRTVTTVVFVAAIGALFSACSNNGPTAPSNNSPTLPRPSSVSNLKITLMTVSDASQDASGHWQYHGTVRLLETGGVELTVTNIQVEALSASNILATASTVPLVLVSANSSSDAVFAFAADTHVQVSALTVKATVEFRDANGNTGAVSSSFSCFGCWDY